MRRAAAVLLSALVSGCAGSAYSVAHEDAAALRARSSDELCLAFHASPTPGVEAELRARNALTEAEWPLVRSHALAVGMTRTAVLCSWGTIWDGIDGNVHRAVLPGGHVEEQWVYMPAMDITKARYVYLSDGVVTALQD